MSSVGVRAALVSLGVTAVSVAVTCCSAFSLITPDFDTTSLNSTQVELSMPKVNGDRPILTAAVTVGGGPEVPLLVDTGSPGVRVFANQVGSEVTRTDIPVDVTFADGTRFVGIEASAPVSFGGLATKGPITVQLITDVGCAEGKPECVGAVGIEKFSAEQPFDGLFGIGLQAASIYSPLSQLANGSPVTFSVTADPAKGSGAISFNQRPTAPTATFDMPAWAQPRMPNGYPAWASNQAQGCWSYGGQPAQCLPTAFDTGSPTLFTDTRVPGAPAELGPVPEDTVVALAATAGGPPIWSVRAGSTPGRDTVVVAPLDGGNNINSGIALFRSKLVTFDAENGKVLVSDR